MSKSKENSAYQSLKDQTTEVYKVFQQEFRQQIATCDEPEATTRIQILEQIVHKMNSDINRANMKYVGKMIESLNEESIIESKKENS